MKKYFDTIDIVMFLCLITGIIIELIALIFIRNNLTLNTIGLVFLGVGLGYFITGGYNH